MSGREVVEEEKSNMLFKDLVWGCLLGQKQVYLLVATKLILNIIMDNGIIMLVRGMVI